MSDTTFNFAYPIKHGDWILAELDCTYVSQGKHGEPYFQIFCGKYEPTGFLQKRYVTGDMDLNEGDWYERIKAYVETEHGFECAQADSAWEASANIQARRDAVELRAAE